MSTKPILLDETGLKMVEALNRIANKSGGGGGGGGGIELAPDLSGNEEDKAPSVKAVNDGISKYNNKINVAKGGYIFIDDIQGIVKYPTLEEAQAHAETSKNAELLNTIIANTERASLKFGSGFYPFEDEITLKPYLTVTSDCQTATLVFPNGRGLVAKVAEEAANAEKYFHYIDINHINIRSNGNCIDFTGGEGMTHPNNVYKSTFNNLELYSDNGTCIYAGDIVPEGDSQMVFECTFKRICVSAPNGDGFYGLYGLGIVFEEVSDRFHTNNIFHNCWGKWENCNTAYGRPDYFLYIDQNAVTSYGADMYFLNVNMECCTKGGVYVDRDAKQDFAHRTVVLDNVTVIFNPDLMNLTEKITSHPLHFGNYIKNIEVSKLYYYIAGGKQWSDLFTCPESDISVYWVSNKFKGSFQENLSIYDRLNNIVLKPNEVSYEQSARTAEQYKERYKYTPEMHIGYMHGTRGYIPYLVDMATANDKILTLDNYYDGIVLTNNTAQTTLQGLRVKGYNRNSDGRLFYIKNETDYPVGIATGYGYTKLHLNGEPSHSYMHNIPAKTVYVFMTFVKNSVTHLVEIKNFTLE